MMSRRSIDIVEAAMPDYSMRMVPGIPVIDPRTGQNFQEHGPHTAYLRWLLRQPGDLGRYRPADFAPVIAEARYAHYRAGGHRISSMNCSGTRNARRQLEAFTLGLCCGWRALDQVQARWLRAWLGSVLKCDSGGILACWVGSPPERALAEYCLEDAALRINALSEADSRRIGAAGMTSVFEEACRFETWRDVEMLLMTAWRSGISLVDEDGFLLSDWKARYAHAFAMRFPQIV